MEQISISIRRKNKLNFDSSQQEQKERVQFQRMLELKRRKQAHKKQKEQRKLKMKQFKEKISQRESYYNKVETMFEQDSNSRDSFTRVQSKIKRQYPQFSDKSSRASFIQNKFEDDKIDQDKRQKRINQSNQKSQKRNDNKNSNKIIQSKLKLQHISNDPHQKLVQAVAVRWWYCLPPWPPINYPYEKMLKNQGYRLVEANRFHLQQNLFEGYLKAAPVRGYAGIFRTKAKFIDLRPKKLCPSIANFRSKSDDQLTKLLKVALSKQIEELNSLKYQKDSHILLAKKLINELKMMN